MKSLALCLILPVLVLAESYLPAQAYEAQLSIVLPQRLSCRIFLNRGTKLILGGEYLTETLYFEVPEITFKWGFERLIAKGPQGESAGSAILPLGILVSHDKASVALAVLDGGRRQVRLLQFTRRKDADWKMSRETSLHDISYSREFAAFAFTTPLDAREEKLDSSSVTGPLILLTVAGDFGEKWNKAWSLGPKGIKPLSQKIANALTVPKTQPYTIRVESENSTGK